MDALILADGDGPARDELDAAWPGWDTSIGVVIAADGGARLAGPLGVRIDRWVGDGDSLGEDALSRLEASGVPVERANADKDESDTELAIRVALREGADGIVIVGGLALLATEYVWARRMLKTAQAQAEKVQEAAVASPVRTAGTLLFGVALLGLGLAMVFLRDVDLPFWSPVTGGIMAVTALILLATTYLTLRAAKGRETTYTATGPDGQGSARIGSIRR